MQLKIITISDVMRDVLLLLNILTQNVAYNRDKEDTIPLLEASNDF